MLKGRILVGHALHNDLKVLGSSMRATYSLISLSPQAPLWGLFHFDFFISTWDFSKNSVRYLRSGCVQETTLGSFWSPDYIGVSVPAQSGVFECYLRDVADGLVSRCVLHGQGQMCVHCQTLGFALHVQFISRLCWDAGSPSSLGLLNGSLSSQANCCLVHLRMQQEDGSIVSLAAGTPLLSPGVVDSRDKISL